LTCFVDLTTIKHAQNPNANEEVKHVEVNGRDNFANLVLRINSNAVALSATSSVFVIAEYYRFSRLQGNGAVVEIQEINA
jgi:hypothetical protein